MKAYAFKWNGIIAIWSIRYYRKDSVKEAERFFEKPWKEIKKHGYKIVKVKITEI